MKIKYNLIHKDGKARYGRLETNYGVYEMPMFMHVGTQATVKTLDPRDIKEIGSGIILSNTFRIILLFIWVYQGSSLFVEKCLFRNNYLFINILYAVLFIRNINIIFEN